MSANLVDLDQEVEDFLLDKGITGETFNHQRISEKAPDEVIMINSGTIPGALPFDIPIDFSRVEIVVRDTHPKPGKDRALALCNVIHGATPGRLHPTSDLDLLGAFIDERPQRTDNEDKDLAEHTIFAVFRVKKRSN